MGRLIHLKKEQKKRNLDIQNIILDIRQTKKELAWAKLKFEFQTDFDLIDSCIYRMQALEAHYGYLIHIAKQEKITCPMQLLERKEGEAKSCRY